MADLFAFLFYVLLIILVVGLIKPSLFEKILGENATRKRIGIIFGIAAFASLVLAGMTSEEQDVEQANQGNQNQQEQSQNKEEEIKIPEYEVLEKIEHVSTRRLDDKADYFGDILFKNEEEIMDISIKDMKKITERIVEKEDLDYSASFYITEEAYKVNRGIFVPEENKEAIESTGGLEENQEYVSREKREEYMDKGYIGSFEDGELNIDKNSDYYKERKE
jgi:uncharacterized membrane protein YuzA (DUF378 family)